MKNRVATLAILLIAAISTAADAQYPESQPAAERGNRSIVLEAMGNSQIGYWTRSSDGTDVGLDLFVDGIFSEGNDRIAVAITPALKRYLRPNGVLAPYVYFGVPLGYERIVNDNSGAPSTTDDSYNVGGITGFGLEWLPVRQVSIGGHVGLRAYYRDQGEGAFGVRTQSSGVRVHLYF